MAEIKVICLECGKKVSLRGLNGHLRFEHGYDLEKAKKTAADIRVDGLLERLERDVMEQIERLYRLQEQAEKLRSAHQDGVIGGELYGRLITQKGQELTATTRYLQRLEASWQERIGERTGVRPDAETPEEDLLAGIVGELESEEGP